MSQMFFFFSRSSPLVLDGVLAICLKIQRDSMGQKTMACFHLSKAEDASRKPRLEHAIVHEEMVVGSTA